MRHPHVASGGRYPVLRAVAILFMLNALVVIGTGLYWIYQVMNLQIHAMSDRVQFALLILCGTFFATLITIGIAELIKLMIDMEQNTRGAAGANINPATGKKWIEGEETAEGALFRGH